MKDERKGLSLGLRTDGRLRADLGSKESIVSAKPLEKSILGGGKKKVFDGKVGTGLACRILAVPNLTHQSRAYHRSQ